MADNVETEILILIRCKLVPRVSEFLQSITDPILKANLSLLTRPCDLVTLEQLSLMETQVQSDQSISTADKAAAIQLIGTWYLVKVSFAADATAESANKCFDFLQLLSRRDDFDCCVIAEEISSSILNGGLRISNFKELFELVIVLNKYIKSHYGDCTNALLMIEHMVQACIWNDVTELSITQILETLAAFKTLRGMGIQLQVTELESILAEVLLSDISVKMNELNNSFECEEALIKLRNYGFTATLNGKIETLLERIVCETEIDLGGIAVNLDLVEPIYDLNSTNGLGAVSSWAQLEKQSEVPLHFVRKGQLGVIIWKVSLLHTGQILAVKSYFSKTSAHLNAFHTEIQYLSQSSGTNLPYFIKFYGAFSDEYTEDSRCIFRLNIVMEYCSTCLMQDIQDRRTANRPYTEPEFYSVLTQLIDGFSVLETLKIHHQDVKPHNIFITETQCKIGDFNVSKVADPLTTQGVTAAHEIQGTEGYFSPELQSAWIGYQQSNSARIARYNPIKNDVFSLGLSLLQMATLSSVLGLNTSKRKHEISGRINSTGFSLGIKQVLSEMLEFDPSVRKTFTQLKELVRSDITSE